jgi:hypothetical protein
MTATASTEQALELLAAAVDQVCRLDVATLDDLALLEAIRSVEKAKRRLEAVDHPLVAEVDSRGLPGKYVVRGTASFLAGLLKITPREAAARARRARELSTRVTITGERLGPMFPSVAEARTRGAITTAHGDTISSVLARLHARVPVNTVEQAEEFLVEQASHFDATALASIDRRLVDTLDPDGALADEQQQQRRRYLSLSPLGDGMFRICGELDAHASALAMTVLHSLAAPRPAAAGDRDERTGGQRMHDAFRAVLAQSLRSGDLPAAGGVPATVLITMTAEQFESRTGLIATSFGQRLTVDQGLRLADQASVGWVVHNSMGGLLAYGRSNRIASDKQTLALIARDKGCTFPGCTDPPEWTERHHVVPWSEGGPTDLDNLCLLCDFHHDRIDTGGWRIVMRDGVPWFIPPRWLDPDQRPQRNLRP